MSLKTNEQANVLLLNVNLNVIVVVSSEAVISLKEKSSSVYA